MDNHGFIWDYVHACAVGNSTLSDCRPLWEFGVISTFLLLAVVTFFILVTTRVREESRLVH